MSSRPMPNEIAMFFAAMLGLAALGAPFTVGALVQIVSTSACSLSPSACAVIPGVFLTESVLCFFLVGSGLLGLTAGAVQVARPIRD